MGRPRLFTQKQDMQIRLDYEAGWSLGRLTEKWGGSRSGITTALFRAGGTCRVRDLSAEQHSEIVERCNAGEIIEHLAEEMGIYASTITRHLKKDPATDRAAARAARRERSAAGIDFNRVAKRTHTLNQRYFDRLDRDDVCYWAGFIAADGGINTKGNIRVGLAVQDFDHLDKLRLAVDSSCSVRVQARKERARSIGGHKPCVMQDVAVLDLFSKQMAADLARHGIGPRKSLTFCPPTFDNTAMEAAFWRGMVDGDGSLICKTPRAEKPGYVRVQLMGSLATCAAFLKFVQGNTFTLHPTKQPRKPYVVKRMFTITFDGTSLVHQIVSLLYGNATVALDRKLTIAKEILARPIRRIKRTW